MRRSSPSPLPSLKPPDRIPVIITTSGSYRTRQDMTLEEAEAIKATPALFGYDPEIFPYQGSYRLIMQIGGDEKVVNDLLKEMRSNTFS